MTTLTRRAARTHWQEVAPALAPLTDPTVEVAPPALVEGWQALEAVLRVLVADPDLTGQALIAAARQVGVLSLDETHSLLDALAVATRAGALPELAAPSGDVAAVRAAVQIVDRIVHDETLAPPPLVIAAPDAAPAVSMDGARTTPPPMTDASAWAPPVPVSTPAPLGAPPPLAPPTVSDRDATVRTPPLDAPPPLAPPPAQTGGWVPPRIDPLPSSTPTPRRADEWSPPPPRLPQAALQPPPGILTPPPPGERPSGARTAMLVVGALALLIVGGAAGAWYVSRDRTADPADTRTAVESPALLTCRLAFEARDLARARSACADAAQLARTQPDHAIALVYLARLKRSAGDVQGAIADADLAQRLLPRNGIALRELGAAFLDANAPGEARRAFVAAVQGDPQDRLAMGGLACALHRLGRTDEAQRWRGRAGTTTAFDACLAAPPGR